MGNEPKISQTKYAIYLADKHSNKLIKFVEKCPWMIKTLSLISSKEYLDKWNRCAKHDKELGLKSRYHVDLKKISNIDMNATYYRNFSEQYDHSPKIDIINCNNMQRILRKLLKNLSYPSYILQARKEIKS